jgi:hypothetical protein
MNGLQGGKGQPNSAREFRPHPPNRGLMDSGPFDLSGATPNLDNARFHGRRKKGVARDRGYRDNYEPLIDFEKDIRQFEEAGTSSGTTRDKLPQIGIRS